MFFRRDRPRRRRDDEAHLGPLRPADHVLRPPALLDPPLWFLDPLTSFLGPLDQPMMMVEHRALRPPWSRDSSPELVVVLVRWGGSGGPCAATPRGVVIGASALVHAYSSRKIFCRCFFLLTGAAGDGYLGIGQAARGLPSHQKEPPFQTRPDIASQDRTPGVAPAMGNSEATAWL